MASTRGTTKMLSRLCWQSSIRSLVSRSSRSSMNWKYPHTLEFGGAPHRLSGTFLYMRWVQFLRTVETYVISRTSTLPLIPQHFLHLLRLGNQTRVHKRLPYPRYLLLSPAHLRQGHGQTHKYYMISTCGQRASAREMRHLLPFLTASSATSSHALLIMGTLRPGDHSRRLYDFPMGS